MKRSEAASGRAWLRCVLASFAVVLLAGCGGEPGPADGPGAGQPEGGAAAAPRPARQPTQSEMVQYRQSVEKGVELLNSGQFREAAGELSIAAGIQPENVSVLLFLGTAQARSGQYELAQRVLKQAVDLQPDNPAGHYELAQVSISLADLDQAKMHSQIALDLDPENRRALELVGQVMLRTGDPEGALAILETSVANGAARPDTEFNLGVCYMGLKRNEEARDVLENVVQKNPRYIPAWYRLGEVLDILGDVDGASAARRQFTELGGTPPPQAGGN
jgi:Tfp pilus assembly protein PilF